MTKLNFSIYHNRKRIFQVINNLTQNEVKKNLNSARDQTHLRSPVQSTHLERNPFYKLRTARSQVMYSSRVFNSRQTINLKPLRAPILITVEMEKKELRGYKEQFHHLCISGWYTAKDTVSIERKQGTLLTFFHIVRKANEARRGKI